MKLSVEEINRQVGAEFPIVTQVVEEVSYFKIIRMIVIHNIPLKHCGKTYLIWEFNNFIYNY